jgi:hypothetical protein
MIGLNINSLDENSAKMLRASNLDVAQAQSPAQLIFAEFT